MVMGIAEILIFFATFGSFIFIYWIIRNKYAKEDMQVRVRAAANETGSQAAGAHNRKMDLGAAHQTGVSDLFDMTMNTDKSEYKTMFEQAGWNPKNASQTVLLIKIALAIGMMIPMLLLIATVTKFQIQPFYMKFLMVVGSGLVGLVLCDRVIHFFINSRYTRISKDLHSAVELLVVCSKAGMGIEKGMERVAQEVSQYNKDLGREFLLTAIELEVMPNRKVAYENLRKRVNLPLIYGMTTTLIQAEEQGSSISESLKVLSEEFRTQVMMNFERKAAKLPATLSVPVVLFTLPTLMAVILGPAIIKLLGDTSLF